MVDKQSAQTDLVQAEICSHSRQVPQVRGKRTLSQLELIDSLSAPSLAADEVSRYLSIEASKFGVEPKWFEDDEFAIIKF